MLVLFEESSRNTLSLMSIQTYLCLFVEPFLRFPITTMLDTAEGSTREASVQRVLI